MDTSNKKIWKCCPDCYEKNFGELFDDLIGDGKCKHCEGDGTEHAFLTPDVYKLGTGEDLECQHCRGSAQCQTCGGEGRVKKSRYNDEDYNNSSHKDDDETDDDDEDVDDESEGYFDSYTTSKYNHDTTESNTHTSSTSPSANSGFLLTVIGMIVSGLLFFGANNLYESSKDMGTDSLKGGFGPLVGIVVMGASGIAAAICGMSLLGSIFKKK